MMSQIRQQGITMHILLNISWRKDKQTIKFSQLIIYNIKNIFLKKYYTKCDGGASPRHFYKKSKLTISLDQQPEMLFLFHVQVEVKIY